VAAHLQVNGGLDPLPLKCNRAQFRHDLIELEDRFHQYTNVTEWKTHLLHCLDFGGPGPWHCYHPRCRQFNELSELDQYFQTDRQRNRWTTRKCSVPRHLSGQPPSRLTSPRPEHSSNSRCAHSDNILSTDH
jgi:hypothetical protein